MSNLSSQYRDDLSFADPNCAIDWILHFDVPVIIVYQIETNDTEPCNFYRENSIMQSSVNLTSVGFVIRHFKKVFDKIATWMIINEIKFFH